MAFGVVLFTLVAQGTTIQFLLKHLGLSDRPVQIVARERHLGRLYAVQAGMHYLTEMHQDGLLSSDVTNALRAEYEHVNDKLTAEMAELFTRHADLEREVLLQTRREMLQAERGALGDALRQGLISEDVFQELVTDVDRHLEALDIISDDAIPARVG
jgi:monovalent cation:H+ antiporter, CPA1 family